MPLRSNRGIVEIEEAWPWIFEVSQQMPRKIDMTGLESKKLNRFHTSPVFSQRTRPLA